jgi:hypothetical protein
VKQEVIDFPSKQLAPRDKDFKLKEDDNIKKLKKKPDDSALAVPAIAPSTVENKTSAEGTSTLAIITSTPKENINAASETIGISRATGSLDADHDKKDPPLA